MWQAEQEGQVAVDAFSLQRTGGLNAFPRASQNFDYALTAADAASYTVTATAARFATFDAGGDRTPLAQKSVSAMLEMQPFEKTVVDPEAAKK